MLVYLVYRNSKEEKQHHHFLPKHVSIRSFLLFHRIRNLFFGGKNFYEEQDGNQIIE